MKNTKTSTTVINNTNKGSRGYARAGIIAAIIIAVAALGIWAVSSIGGGVNEKSTTVEEALSEVTPDAVSGADMRIAVVRMDAIQNEAAALKNLRKQKESFETKLREELTKTQKELEKEKSEIEKSQDVLSRDALQRRVSDYQARVSQLQRDLTERAQGIEASYQKALANLQENHLDPLMEGIIKKKNLSLVVDGRFARTGADAAKVDITTEVVRALNKKVSSVRMETPKGF